MSPSRAALYSLVDQVPEELLPTAARALTELVHSPPLAGEVEAAIREGMAQHARGESIPKAEAFRRLDAMIAASRADPR